MDELIDLIKDYFKKTNGKYTKEELKKVFNIKGEKQTAIFNCALNELVIDGCLFFDKKNHYRLFTNDIGFAYGQIEINKNGCGFVHTKDGYTILIENIDLNGSLNGDFVIVSSINAKRKDFYSGKVYKVLKRKNGFAIYEVIGNGKNASLIPYDNSNNVNVSINKNELKNLINGELIKVSIGTKEYDGEYEATIVDTVGHIDDPNIDIKLIADKYNIPIDFSNEVMEEANKLPKEVTIQDCIGRVDLRDKNIVTIDCDNTKDRDDAVYVEKLPNGNYKLLVSISSVNYYIKEGMKLYDEAIKRCTSHYPNNSCIPMFPHIISNGICSLNPNVDRLTKTCEMEIDKNGNVVNVDVYNSVINSKMAMKYSEVNDVLNGKQIQEYEPFSNQLILMKELNDILSNARNKRNSMNFDIPDVEVIQDENNIPIEFKETGVGEAEKIIENFMLTTNNCIAEYFSWMPIIYRIHEFPNPNTVKNAIKALNDSGIKIPKINNIDGHSIKNILDSIGSSEEGKIIKSILLKSMKRAKYDTINCGHFALQLDKYCHFTSPIRRIPDFLIHTIIDKMMDPNFNYDNIDKLEKDMIDLSNKATYAEQIDKEIENESKLMAMAEYMEKHIGEEFEAYITDISKNGMFVITNDHIPGKVKITDILDDKYYFEKNKIIGKNSKKQYRIGNKIFVVSKEASKRNRTINFKIVKQKTLK